MEPEGFSFDLKPYCNKCDKFEPVVKKSYCRYPKGFTPDWSKLDRSDPKNWCLQIYDRKIGCGNRNTCDYYERLIMYSQPQNENP